MEPNPEGVGVVINDEEISPENNKLKAVLSGDYSLHQGAYKTIKVSCAARPKDILEISFIRTVKVPDNRKTYQLPPGRGNFPIYNVQDYKAKFPPNIADKGGIFFPMYQREAMWMNFSATRPFAIKMYVGGINVISGEPAVETLITFAHRQKLIGSNMPIQDYLVAGPTSKHQPWIDGIVKEDGSVSQFVAMPQSSGVTVEKQISGHDAVGGIQIEVVPVKSRHYMTVIVRTLAGKSIYFDVTPYTYVWELKLMVHSSESIPPEKQRFKFSTHWLSDTATLHECNVKHQCTIHLVLNLLGGGFESAECPRPPYDTEHSVDAPVELGIAPGGSITQAVRRDYHPALLWDKNEAMLFNVRIINSSLFPSITGLPAPETPIDAATYSCLGYPFFALYNEMPTGIVGNFKGVKTIDGQQNEAGGHGKEAHGGDKAVQNNPSLRFRTVVLDWDTRLCRFRSVAELEQEVLVDRLARRTRWEALGLPPLNSDTSEEM